MNEQIKQLAIKAGGEFWQRIENDVVNPEAYITFDPPESLDKFVELIVRECLDIADGQKKWVEDMEVFNEHDATWNKARIQQRQQILDKIKQHFGVEE